MHKQFLQCGAETQNVIWQRLIGTSCCCVLGDTQADFSQHDDGHCFLWTKNKRKLCCKCVLSPSNFASYAAYRCWNSSSHASSTWHELSQGSLRPGQLFPTMVKHECTSSPEPPLASTCPNAAGARWHCLPLSSCCNTTHVLLHVIAKGSSRMLSPTLWLSGHFVCRQTPWLSKSSNNPRAKEVYLCLRTV